MRRTNAISSLVSIPDVLPTTVPFAVLMSWYSPAPSDPNTGQTQWDPPSFAEQGVPASGPAPAGGHPKRRQYAAGQTQAYYGDSGVVHPPAPGDMAGNAVVGGSFFTPAGGDQPPAQPSGFYNPAAIGQGPGVFSAGGFVAPSQPSAYQQQQQPQVGALTDQFSQMGLQQPGYGQKQVSRPHQRLRLTFHPDGFTLLLVRVAHHQPCRRIPRSSRACGSSARDSASAWGELPMCWRLRCARMFTFPSSRQASLKR